MKCPVCKKEVILVRIGKAVGVGPVALIGIFLGFGKELTACPECGVVFYEQAIETKK